MKSVSKPNLELAIGWSIVAGLLIGWFFGFAVNPELLGVDETVSASGEAGEAYAAADMRAQQLMARQTLVNSWISFFALLGLIATVVYAARAARTAVIGVEETRSIGQAQVRAYLSFVDGTFRINKNTLTLQPKLRNSGQSPAIAPHMTALIVHIRVSQRLRESSFDIPGTNGIDDDINFLDISASSEEKGFLNIDVSFLPDDYFLTLVKSGEISVSVTAVMNYFDVFGERHQEFPGLRLFPDQPLSEDGTLEGTLRNEPC